LLLKILVQLFKHCCGTGMFISDSDFFSSWIPDLRPNIPDTGSNINKKD
jgi:hypothetical protein